MSTHPSPDQPPEIAFDVTFEDLYEMAPCGYLTTSVDGRIIRANGTLTEWLGYTREELTGGKRLVDLFTVGGRIFYETHLNLLLRMQGAVHEIAVDVVAHDRRVLPMLMNAKQQRDAGGEPILNHFAFFNSIERRTYERELVAARNLLQITLASIGDGVITTDAEGRVTFLNPVAEALSGWSNDAAEGKPVEEVLVLLSEQTSRKIENPITRALREGKVVGLENHTVLLSRDGERIPIDDSAAPIRDADGVVAGCVLVFRDISAQRAAERSIRLAHERLERQAVELRRSNEDLSQFAYVASHDLRSPLNTVMQFSQLLERRYGDQLGDGKELLGYVTRATKRMASLIDDLLSYARASSEEERSPEPVDANVPVETAIDNLQALIKESGATITRDVLPVVPVSGTSLVQIFQNLIGNAIHYRGTEPPRIHISGVEQNEQWLFSCKDNGMGIPVEHQALIFEAFKRLHGSDRPGSGIGLAVCQRIVERYGGRIWVESEVEKGSTFYFTFAKG